MDKLTETIFLLILIAISIQTYLNKESNYGIAQFYIVPITINLLLILINAFSRNDLEYKKGVKKILYYSLVISGIYFFIIGYFVQLSKAFRH